LVGMYSVRQLKRVLVLEASPRWIGRYMTEFIALHRPLDVAALRSRIGNVGRIQFDEPLSDSEYRALAGLLERHPRVTLRAFGFDAGLATLGFLRWFPNLRRVSVANLHHLTDLAGLRYLPDDLEFLDLGETQKPLDLRSISFRRLAELRAVGHRRGLTELLANNHDLRVLSLWRLPVDESLSDVALPDLRSLALTLGSVKNLSWLKQFPRLQYLAIRRVRGVSDLTAIGDLPALEWLWLDELKDVETLPDLSHAGQLCRVDLTDLRNMREPHALDGLSRAPALTEVSLVASRLPVGAFAGLAEHPRLQRIAVGLGDTRRNQEVSQLFSLPEALPMSEFAEARGIVQSM
jgi:hypothetical protein